MVSAMDQVIVTLQNDVSNVWKAIAQEAAAYVHQQWDHVFGNIPAVPQPSSGSGSGSSAMTTGHNAHNQPLNIATQQAGHGSGSGSSHTTTVHEGQSLAGSGTGTGSGSGSGSGTVSGIVWGDSDGDGILDNGETGIPGITVNLDDPTGAVLMTTTTDQNGNYQFTVPVDPNFGSQFEI
ncbi:MAG TPA: SdrD B-like domain-containing protein [Gemmataceae bacterium]|jgi:hypothetical protein